MKVRLILLFPPLTHPETELDLRGTWATLRRGGGKSEYGAGWTEAKVILNISHLSHKSQLLAQIAPLVELAGQTKGVRQAGRALNAKDNPCSPAAHCTSVCTLHPRSVADFSQIVLIW